MVVATIIHRHIFKEMLAPFLINVAFFNFIFLMTRILEITNLVVNYKISLTAVLRILIYSMPYFLMFILPMSTMLTVLLTFLRMSADNEILALKTGGVSLYRLLPPVLAFGLITCLLTGFMAVHAMPWGNRQIKALTLSAAASSLDAGIKARTFNDSFKGVMLYVNRIDVKNRELIDVFIEDQRRKNVVSAVIAPRGRMMGEAGRFTYRLQLDDGIINQVNLAGRTVHSIRFDTYDILLDLKKSLAEGGEGSKDELEMTLPELRHYLKTETERHAQYYVSLLEYHKKFSISFACLALGLLGVPLGIQGRSANRSVALGLGIAFFLLYYILLSLGWVFGENGAYPPVIGMWMPNAVMAAIGLYLLVRSARERPVHPAFVWRRIERVVERVTGKTRNPPA